jgi:hypothetical protein
MSKKPKLAPHEAWDALEKMGLDDEAERVGALSYADLDGELEGAGIDPKALRARGAALAAKLAAARQQSTAKPGAATAKPSAAAAKPGAAAPVPLRRRWVALLVAATLGGVALIAATPALMTLAQRTEALPEPVAAPAPLPRENAGALLRDAARACRERRWLECRHALDGAKALDPAGEATDEVKSWRRAIESAIGPEKR